MIFSPRIRKISFSFFTVIVFFGLLEGVLRLAGVQPKIRLQQFELPAWLATLDPLLLDAYEGRLAAQGFVNEDIYAYRADEELGYRLKPNLNLRVRNYSSPAHVDRMPEWTIISNSRGFRAGSDPEEPSHPDNPVRTIHVLGDSSSFGWGVDFEETYAYVLREKLNASLEPGEAPFAVRNHAMPGYSSFQGRRLMQGMDAIGKGDLVLVSFGGNDSLPVITSDRLRHERRKSLTGRLNGALSNFLFYRTLRATLINLAGWKKSEAQRDTFRVSLKDYQDNLKTMFAIAEEKEARPVFVNVCNFYEFPAVAESLSREKAVPFFNFPEQLKAYLPAVAALFPEKFMTYFKIYGDLMNTNESFAFLFPDNCHPNVIGHRLMGEIIFRTLQDESGLRSEIP